MGPNEPGQPVLNLAEASTAFSRNLPIPATALAIGAHPDDVEFGCGGTVAKWAAAGCVVHHLICTDGSKGTWNVAADTAALVQTRQREQRVAAARLGTHGQVVFLGNVDGELQSSLAERSEVARWIRMLKPDVVLGHDPWKHYRIHPDHRHAGFLACEGVVAARDPHFFKDHDIAPHRPSAILLWEAEQANHVEDVSGSVDVKLNALLAHWSQFESTMKAVDDTQINEFRQRITDRLASIGAPFGLAAAEAFALIDDL